MKARFSSLDLVCEVAELQARLIGMRVIQVYDVDSKTFLLKLQRPPEEKAVLLIESGTRLHTTRFEWPKNAAPSGFSMKLRKHINNKRLSSLQQMGVDRVVDLQFGDGEAAYHIVLELYDKGNVVLTDANHKILNILRPRVQGEDKFLVRETYPVELAKQTAEVLTLDRLNEIVAKAKPGESLKKALTTTCEFGPALLDHLLLSQGLHGGMKIGKDFTVATHGEEVVKLLNSAEEVLKQSVKRGYIVQKREVRPSDAMAEEEFFTFVEFNPIMLRQNENKPFLEFPTFDEAVDEFFSKIESQKIDLKALAQQKAAFKKLDNVRRDHEHRLDQLQREQSLDHRKGELIELNQRLVEAALTVIRSAIANQIDWKEIAELVKEAAENKDPVASRIKDLKLSTNHFSMLLSDPFGHLDEEFDDEEQEEKESLPTEMVVDIDLDLSAQANARRFFHQKKSAAVKERKTIESQSVALKSAERKTRQTLKEAAVIATISKARKVFWFEKFIWFISSENYLVIAGRDVQQNELIVKRYMRAGDIYVHADLHGAATVVVKNPSGLPVPPKTLSEAGHMAICYSAAWESKVVAAAWWVESSQVSKTAPSGEYLTAGSFMIRGKKNFLTPAPLVLGFGFLFKLEDGSVERHRGERKVRTLDDLELASVTTDGDAATDANDDEEEIPLNEDEDAESDHEAKSEPPLHPVDEEPTESVKEEAADNAKPVNDGEPASEAKDDVSESEPDSDDEDDGKAQFPDTTVDIRLSSRGEVTLRARGLSEQSGPGEEAPQTVTFVEKSRKSTKEDKNLTEKMEDLDVGQKQQQQQKRGKKGKMKKIKEKYKDQDEEERQLRMKLLQGEPKPKDTKSKKGGKKGEEKKPPRPPQGATKQPRPQAPRAQAGEAVDEDEHAAPVTVNAEVDMLDSLTGIPLPEDEILFAVPVVAPYNTLTSYKFKVKVTPGSGKRGKATKTALSVFMADKTTTVREKDLLRSVKDQDLARNLPGKVKLSAPNMQKAAKASKKK